MPAPGAGSAAAAPARFVRYCDLLRKWNRSINLVARSTIGDLEARHLVDSAAIWPHVPPMATRLADLGSGGGFPGLVLAILADDERPDMAVHLVESDARKAAFLETVRGDLGLVRVSIHNNRIEELAPLCADVITARALAPLDRLLTLAFRHLAPDGCCLFSKGRTWSDEVASARRLWNFDLQAHAAPEGGEGSILQVKGLTRV